MMKIFAWPANSCLTLFVFLLVGSMSGADLPQPEAAVPEFQKNDRVAIVGDSITHAGWYQAHIYLFYATRFPTREFRIFNCGISGDSAPGTLSRLDWDVLNHQPNRATILLGMNDVGVASYGEGKDDEKTAALRQQRRQSFQTNLTNLVEALLKHDIHPILMTTTVYEEMPSLKAQNYRGANAGLGLISEEIRASARKFKLGLVDLYTPMNAINRREQSRNPDFTIVSGDRVHPGSAGHFVMAYLFLKAQAMPQLVSRMVVDAATRSVVEQDNCTVTITEPEDAAIAFDCTEKALPFPIAKPQVNLFKIVPFQEDLNQELLVVRGLAEGNYRLLIDNSPVGEFSARELEQGVNLAVLPDTPMFKQAEKVAALNLRHHQIGADLQYIGLVRKAHLDKAGIDHNDFEKAKEFLKKTLATVDREYTRNCINKYLENKPREKELEKKLADLATEMYRVNQPAPHKFRIVPFKK